MKQWFFIETKSLQVLLPRVLCVIKIQQEVVCCERMLQLFIVKHKIIFTATGDAKSLQDGLL